jgi:hypothetical protein
MQLLALSSSAVENVGRVAPMGVHLPVDRPLANPRWIKWIRQVLTLSSRVDFRCGGVAPTRRLQERSSGWVFRNSRAKMLDMLQPRLTGRSSSRSQHEARFRRRAECVQRCLRLRTSALERTKWIPLQLGGVMAEWRTYLAKAAKSSEQQPPA